MNMNVKKKKISRVVFRRRGFVIITLLVQIAFLISLVVGADIFFRYANLIFSTLSIAVCVHVLNRHTKAAYKITWIFLILLFPFFGGLMYVFFHIQSTSRKLRQQIDKIRVESRSAFHLDGDCLPQFVKAHPGFEPQARYLQDYVGFPVFSSTRTLYFDSGESFFRRVLEELEKAERYIFLEFFILREGEMLGSIFSILERKAKEGLDVRLIYDDVGCFLSLPPDFKQTLAKKGIKCIVFNPFRPVLSSQQNNRNHRKIISIDGKVAFTGGVNIGDEYINAISRFGRWKDAAIMLEGEGAWSFALIFLQMWNTVLPENGVFPPDNYESFYPGKDGPHETGPGTPENAGGFVQPYSDAPVDEDNVCEHVYIQIINRARKYVYINTPYLVLDDSLLSALTLAAKSGVDVRIITPHRWDKWIVAFTSRSYYRQLISAGVKVYEYTSGFNHGKTFVSDDIVATVGTANLDFRSLYLHFECGVVVYEGDAILALKEDFLRTVPISHEITLKECSRNVFQRVFSDVLRIFAPLM
ncbi:MAG: cardiolipin synthase [Treponema sp.]|nr:cardiolipin synthase [Treponema sp.]